MINGKEAIMVKMICDAALGAAFGHSDDLNLITLDRAVDGESNYNCK